jgi:hypothetical protein
MLEEVEVVERLLARHYPIVVVKQIAEACLRRHPYHDSHPRRHDCRHCGCSGWWYVRRRERARSGFCRQFRLARQDEYHPHYPTSPSRHRHRHHHHQVAHYLCSSSYESSLLYSLAGTVAMVHSIQKGVSAESSPSIPVPQCVLLLAAQGSKVTEGPMNYLMLCPLEAA